MAVTFEDLVRQIEEDASPEQLRELDAARARFEVGTKILKQRLALGLTQSQLEAESGVSQADISRIEHGQANPTATTLQALAGPLGLSLDLVKGAS